MSILQDSAPIFAPTTSNLTIFESSSSGLWLLDRGVIKINRKHVLPLQAPLTDDHKHISAYLYMCSYIWPFPGQRTSNLVADALSIPARSAKDVSGLSGLFSIYIYIYIYFYLYIFSLTEVVIHSFNGHAITFKV